MLHKITLQAIRYYTNLYNMYCRPLFSIKLQHIVYIMKTQQHFSKIYYKNKMQNKIDLLGFQLT